MIIENKYIEKGIKVAKNPSMIFIYGYYKYKRASLLLYNRAIKDTLLQKITLKAIKVVKNPRIILVYTYYKYKKISLLFKSQIKKMALLIYHRFIHNSVLQKITLKAIKITKNPRLILVYTYYKYKKASLLLESQIKKTAFLIYHRLIHNSVFQKITLKTINIAKNPRIILVYTYYKCKKIPLLFKSQIKKTAFLIHNQFIHNSISQKIMLLFKKPAKKTARFVEKAIFTPTRLQLIKTNSLVRLLFLKINKVFNQLHRISITFLSHYIDYFFKADLVLKDLREALKWGGAKNGITYLKKRYPLFRPAHARFLIHLYTFLLKPQPLQIENAPFKRNLIIHFCCWGKSYATKAAHYLLPSLLAPDNLPRLAKEYNVIILIHCDLEAEKTIAISSAAEHLRRYARMILVTLPKKIMRHYHRSFNYAHFLNFKEINRSNHVIKYFLLGALQSNVLNFGIKNQALLSFLMPDTLLSSSFFTQAVSKIQEKKLVFSSTFRTDFWGVFHQLEKFRDPNNDAILPISEKELTKLQINYLHPSDKRRIISEKTEHFIPCPRFIFKTEHGLVLRALHYHPVLMDCKKIDRGLQMDYLPIDDFILKRILDLPEEYEKHVWICDDPLLMNFMELSGEEPMLLEAPTFKGLFFSYETLLNTLHSMLTTGAEDLNGEINRFFIKNKLLFMTNQSQPAQDEIINDDDFIDDLYDRLGEKMES